MCSYCAAAGGGALAAVVEQCSSERRLCAEGEEPSSDTKPGLQGLDVNVMVKQGPDAAEHSDIKKSYLLKQVCNVVSRTVIP